MSQVVEIHTEDESDPEYEEGLDEEYETDDDEYREDLDLEGRIPYAHLYSTNCDFSLASVCTNFTVIPWLPNQF